VYNVKILRADYLFHCIEYIITVKLNVLVFMNCMMFIVIISVGMHIIVFIKEIDISNDINKYILLQSKLNHDVSYICI